MRRMLPSACNFTGHQEEDPDDNQRVTEIKESRGSSRYVKFHDKIMNAVDKEIHGGETTGQEGAPPPMIVLQRNGHNVMLPLSHIGIRRFHASRKQKTEVP